MIASFAESGIFNISGFIVDNHARRGSLIGSIFTSTYTLHVPILIFGAPRAYRYTSI